MNRRMVLTTIGVGLVSVSGCSQQGPVAMGSRDYPDVEFFNNTSEALTVTLRAVADGEQILAETFSVPAGSTNQPAKTYEEFDGTRTLTVHVSVENGPTESHEFEDSTTDSKTLTVELYSDELKFLVSGA